MCLIALIVLCSLYIFNIQDPQGQLESESAINYEHLSQLSSHYGLSELGSLERGTP